MRTTSTEHLLTGPSFLFGAGALGVAAAMLAREDFARWVYELYLEQRRMSREQQWWIRNPYHFDPVREDGPTYRTYKYVACVCLILMGTTFIAVGIIYPGT
jgi:hypothetical protein